MTTGMFRQDPSSKTNMHHGVSLVTRSVLIRNNQQNSAPHARTCVHVLVKCSGAAMSFIDTLMDH